MTISVTHAFHSAIADDPASVAAGQVVPSNWNANHTVTGAMELATADVTYYVNSDTGSDSNPGTSGSPFLTQVKAWNTICDINGAGYTATIQFQYPVTNKYDHLYVHGLGFGNTAKTPTGWGHILFKGDPSSRSSVKVVAAAVVGGACYNFASPIDPWIHIQDMTFDGYSTFGDSNGIHASAPCQIICLNIINTDNDFMYTAQSGAYIIVFGDIRMTAVNTTPHSILLVNSDANIDFFPYTNLTTDGNINPLYFAEAHLGGCIQGFVNPTFKAALTGFTNSPFWADSGAQIYATGGALDNFPGPLPGVCTDNGVYASAPGVVQNPAIRIVPAPVLDSMIVANLPSSCLEGSVAFVTDSSASPTALSVVTGGGSTHVPVIFLNGVWKYLTGVSSSGLTINSTTISGGAANKILYDDGTKLQEATVGSNLTLSGGTLSASSGSGITIGTTTISGGTTKHVLYDLAGVVQEAANFTIESGNPNVITGNHYLYNGQHALYAQPSQANWFIGDNGPVLASVSGTENLSQGSFALGSLTSGNNNVAFGYSSLSGLTTGNGNVGLGASSLAQITSSDNNMAVGFQSLFNLTTSANDNVAIGAAAGFNLTGACVGNILIGKTAAGNGTSAISEVIAIGSQALVGTTANENVGIGSKVFVTATSDAHLVGIGYHAGWNLVGSSGHVTLIGHQSGSDLTTGDANTFVGSQSGQGITSGRANTVLGKITGLSTTLSNSIILGDGDNNIRGDYNKTNSNKWTFSGANILVPSQSTAGFIMNDSSGNLNSVNTVAAATVAANFTADHRIQITVAGTTYYLPVSTTAW